MPSLSDEDQGKIRYHLNYRTGIVDAGVMSWLLTSMNTIQDNYALVRIRASILRCEQAEEEAITGGQDTDNSSYGLASKEIYDGDIVRTRIQLREIPLKERWEGYYLECDHLANTLNVPNLRRPGNLESYSHLVTGGAYIKAIPGPADTCVSDKIYLSHQYL